MTLTEVSMVLGVFMLLVGGLVTALEDLGEARRGNEGSATVQEQTEPARFGVRGWSTGGAVSTIPADRDGR